MAQPTPESIELAQDLMDDEEPLVGYIALIIGKVMENNSRRVSDILKKYRGEFEARGAGGLFTSLSIDISQLFEDYINQDEDNDYVEEEQDPNDE